MEKEFNTSPELDTLLDAIANMELTGKITSEQALGIMDRADRIWDALLDAEKNGKALHYNVSDDPLVFTEKEMV